jgi:hypothetical protein
LSDSQKESQEIYEDPERRSRLIELLAIASLLTNCIIERNYRLSDGWVQPLQFTELGQQTIDECMKRHRRLKPNDAKMAVFLAFECADGFFVDLSTDIEALRQQISNEVLHGRVMYPYIFGRELHDRAAELYPAATELDNHQTIELLSDLPIGVFQNAHTVVGPYGCTFSDVPRQAGSSLSVPGYRCPNEACDSIHRLRLKSAESSIFRARGLVSRFIERNYSHAADETVPLINKSYTMEYVPHSSFPMSNLIDVLSDGLAEEELRSVINYLLRTTFKRQGRRMDIAKRLGAAIINPSDFVANLTRPNLMQIALLHSDSDIIKAIDDSISQHELNLEDFEIRVSRVRRWDRDQAFPKAEIGVFGARFTSYPSSRFVTYRMLRLLHQVYYQSDIFDAGDLAYAIEAPNDLNDGELLDRAVRDYQIRDLFLKLILPHRKVAALAAHELNLFDHENLSRDELLERLRWKIGEPGATGFKDLDRIDQYLPNVEAANNEMKEEDIIRASATILFTTVESTLNQALIFCTWAFSSDHYLSTDGFVYDPLTDPAIVKFIETNAPTEIPELELKHNARNTLVPLGAGFARLAKALRNLSEDDCVRPSDDIPMQCIASSRPFAFPFTRTFLNLATSARSDVLTALQAT